MRSSQLTGGVSSRCSCRRGCPSTRGGCPWHPVPDRMRYVACSCHRWYLLIRGLWSCRPDFRWPSHQSSLLRRAVCSSFPGLRHAVPHTADVMCPNELLSTCSPLRTARLHASPNATHQVRRSPLPAQCQRPAAAVAATPAPCLCSNGPFSGRLRRQRTTRRPVRRTTKRRGTSTFNICAACIGKWYHFSKPR